ncbi:MAG TPA: ABC transporter permease [Bacillota bacterium]|nr:ABC transporter permease [Bacillota bacterium]
MLRFIVQRVIFSIISLFIIVSATFFLMKAVPGNPISNENDDIPQEILEAMLDHYGLNDPLHIQYVNYLKSVVTWDLGPSYTYKGTTVNEIINSGFPVSFILGMTALVIGVSGGLILGIVSALNHNRMPDYMAMIVAVIGISVPNFILAALLQYVFAIKLGWLPVAKWGSPNQIILPSLALAALPLAFVARLTRSSMLEVLSENYIKTAKSKGIKQSVITVKHALRNAILPVITYIGPLAVSILTGTFVIEKIFGIPGLGSHFVMSIMNRDYTVIMGTAVFYSVLLLGVILLVDLSYGIIDPRIKFSNKKER